MWTFLNPLHLLKFIFRSRGSAERMSDGDHVLDALGIANSSYGAGSFTLWKMLGSHLLLALIGLIFTNSND